MPKDNSSSGVDSRYFIYYERGFAPRVIRFGTAESNRVLGFPERGDEPMKGKKKPMGKGKKGC